ncbi:hypothetical protein N0V90_006445 [Kalmusia sp. IMI 367209]|nr:hypothetical protein N0V90_006445 [Kalmusia sp. IMI 367209]
MMKRKASSPDKVIPSPKKRQTGEAIKRHLMEELRPQGEKDEWRDSAISLYANQVYHLMNGHWKLHPYQVKSQFGDMAINEVWVFDRLLKWQEWQVEHQAETEWKIVFHFLETAKGCSSSWMQDHFSEAFDKLIAHQRREASVVMDEPTNSDHAYRRVRHASNPLISTNDDTLANTVRPQTTTIARASQSTTRSSSSPSSTLGQHLQSMSNDNRNFSEPPMPPSPYTSPHPLSTSLSTARDEDPTMNAIPRLIHELKSPSSISTHALYSILDILLANRTFNDPELSPEQVTDLRGIEILDLYEMLHPSSTGGSLGNDDRATDFDAEIRSWSPSKIPLVDGTTTFLLPFNNPARGRFILYILSVEKKRCVVVHTEEMKEDEILMKVLPTKLTVAVNSQNAHWTVVPWLWYPGRDVKKEDLGIQMVVYCLWAVGSHRDIRDIEKKVLGGLNDLAEHDDSGENIWVTSEVDTGFWRALLATTFDQDAGIKHFDDWVTGK